MIVIGRVLLLLIAIVQVGCQCEQESICVNLKEREKILIAKGQTREMLLSDYIRGFNLSFELDSMVSGVELHKSLTQVGQTSSGCPASQISVAGVQMNGDGDWENHVAVATYSEGVICFSIGRVDQNKEITIVRKGSITEEGITRCTYLGFLAGGRILLECQSTEFRLIWLIGETNVRRFEFAFTGNLVKSILYRNNYMVQITQENMLIWQIGVDVQLIKSYSAEDFNRSFLTLTDIDIGQYVMLTDYINGCLRFRLSDDFSILQLEIYQIKDSFTLKVTHVDARYFVLSKMEMSEVIWTDTFRIGAVYQVPNVQATGLSANQYLIAIQSDLDVYVYRRDVTNFNQVLAKFTNTAQILLNPSQPWLIVYEGDTLKTYQIGYDYLTIANVQQSTEFALTAISRSGTEDVCQLSISLQVVQDINKIYETLEKPPSSLTIPTKTKLVLPVGKYYQGLNLKYVIENTPSLKFTLKQIESTSFLSFFKNKPLLMMHSLDESNFYRLTSDTSSINIQKCYDRILGGAADMADIICTQVRTKTFTTRITKLKLLKSITYGILFTYMTDDLGSIFIEDIQGKQSWKFTIAETTKFTRIDDYAINDEHIFVLHGMLNRIDVYRIATSDKLGQITNSLRGNKLFKPRRIEASTSHPQCLYIENVDSVILMTYNIKPTLNLELNVNVSSYGERFYFKHTGDSLILANIQTSQIGQYSLKNFSNPVLLKNIPLLGNQLPVEPNLFIVNKYLVVNTKSKNVLIAKLGESMCNSILLNSDFAAGSQIQVVATSSLLVFYESPSGDHLIKRIYTTAQIEGTPVFEDFNNFIEKFPFSYEVKSSGENKNVSFLLRVANYYRGLTANPPNPKDGINLPLQAHGEQYTFDDQGWFEGAVIWYQLECDYCPDKFVPTYHIQRLVTSNSIEDTVHLLPTSERIYMLTPSAILITDWNEKLVIPPIEGSFDNCVHLTKGIMWMIAFCREEVSNSDKPVGYFQPISLISDGPFPLEPIRIPTEHQLSNVLHSVYFSKRFIFLDNNLFANGTGVIRIFKQVGLSSGMSLEHELQLSGNLFSKDAGIINGFDYQQINCTTFQMYLTLSNLGIVIMQMKFTDSIQYTWRLVNLLAPGPSFMQKYMVDKNSALQVKVIGRQSHHINTTHNSVETTVILTTSLAAHLQLQLFYSEERVLLNLQIQQVALIQAFSRYGTQTVLNFLGGVTFRASSEQNMFVVQYYNQTRYSVSLCIYPVTTNDSSLPKRQFQNPKGGSFIQTTDTSLLSTWLGIDAEGYPLLVNNILPNKNIARKSSPVINRLSNKLKITATYDKPSSDEYITFWATNDYGQAAYKYPLTFQVQSSFAWYWIVVGCVGLILLLVVGCLAYRRHRIKKERQEKLSLIQSVEQQIEVNTTGS